MMKTKDIIESNAEPKGMDMEMLIAKAIEQNISVDVMERLLAIRKELREEFAKEQYDRAMSLFQAECPIIEKKEKAGGSSGYGYKYAPLDQIVAQVKDLLAANGFSYTFDTQKLESTIVVICHVKHRDGHSETSRFEAVVDTAGKMNATQKDGSASTYGKRYAFCNAFGILTGDEDTDAVTPKPEAKASEPESRPASQQESGLDFDNLISNAQINLIARLIRKHKPDGSQYTSLGEFEAAMSEKQGKPFEVAKLTKGQAAQLIESLVTRVGELRQEEKAAEVPDDKAPALWGDITETFGVE